MNAPMDATQTQEPAPDAAAPDAAERPWKTDPDTLLARLAELGIEARTVTHPPVHTVAESRALRDRGKGSEIRGGEIRDGEIRDGEIEGGHCKSLFLKDRKGRLFLVITLESTPVDMKILQAVLGSARLSFGKPDLLWEVLGVRPGAVTPFAAINDPEGRVEIVLDDTMLAAAKLSYHPLANDRSTSLAPDGLLRFLESTGHAPRRVDVTRPPG